MSLRLYMDEDSLHAAVLRALRRNGFDCLTAEEAGRRRQPDNRQLAFATSVDRVVFTRNTGDFSALHAAWVQAGRPHSGIIVLTDQKADVGVIERSMKNLSERFDGVSIRNQLVHLLNFAVRDD